MWLIREDLICTGAPSQEKTQEQISWVLCLCQESRGCMLLLSTVQEIPTEQPAAVSTLTLTLSLGLVVPVILNPNDHETDSIYWKYRMNIMLGYPGSRWLRRSDGYFWLWMSRGVRTISGILFLGQWIWIALSWVIPEELIFILTDLGLNLGLLLLLHFRTSCSSWLIEFSFCLWAIGCHFHIWWSCFLFGPSNWINWSWLLPFLFGFFTDHSLFGRFILCPWLYLLFEVWRCEFLTSSGLNFMSHLELRPIDPELVYLFLIRFMKLRRDSLDIFILWLHLQDLSYQFFQDCFSGNWAQFF